MTQIRFDFSTIDPRLRLILAIVAIILVVGIIALIVFNLGGDGDGPGSATGRDAPIIAEATTPSPQVVETQPPAGPATETPTPTITATIQPYEYEVQAGDTLLFILTLFGYRDTRIVSDVLLLNNMPNENALFAGQTILIPRQTPTLAPTATITPTHDPLLPTRTPLPPTATIDPLFTPIYDNCSPSNRCLSPDGQYWVHVVGEGQTISMIAGMYNSTVNCIQQLNSLGEFISEGQTLHICILVTLTPTLTPTGGAASTATPTPTIMPPSLFAPANRQQIPRGDDVTLQWAAERPLEAGQSYLISVTDTESGTEERFVTRSNSFRLPEELRPGTGRSITYQWRIVIVAGNDTGSPAISGPTEPFVFTWAS